jgi:hypothetical protein
VTAGRVLKKDPFCGFEAEDEAKGRFLVSQNFQFFQKGKEERCYKKTHGD